MSTMIKHRKIHIFTMAPGESIVDHCRPRDIALVQEGERWWTHFVGEDGNIESYDIPFDSYNKALWAAKAAAEFESE